MLVVLLVRTVPVALCVHNGVGAKTMATRHRPVQVHGGSIRPSAIVRPMMLMIMSAHWNRCRAASSEPSAHASVLLLRGKCWAVTFVTAL